MNIEGRRRNPANIFDREELWEMLDGTPRENHHDFATRELRRTVSLNASAFLSQSQREPEGLRKRMHALWDLVTRRYDPEFCATTKPSDFFNESVVLDQHAGILIYMPPARAFGEVLFVLLVVSSVGGPKGRDHHYLTGELGRAPDGRPVVSLWEWTDRDHVFVDLVEGPEYADGIVATAREALARGIC